MTTLTIVALVLRLWLGGLDLVITLCLVLSAFDWPLDNASFVGLVFRGALLLTEAKSPANGISSSPSMVESNRLRTLTCMSNAVRLAWKYLATPRVYDGTQATV